jgi:hypothetical protein
MNKSDITLTLDPVRANILRQCLQAERSRLAPANGADSDFNAVHIGVLDDLLKKLSPPPLTVGDLISTIESEFECAIGAPHGVHQLDVGQVVYEVFAFRVGLPLPGAEDVLCRALLRVIRLYAGALPNETMKLFWRRPVKIELRTIDHNAGVEFDDGSLSKIGTHQALQIITRLAVVGARGQLVLSNGPNAIPLEILEDIGWTA